MDKYHYEIELVDFDDLKDMLNTRGHKGWKLVFMEWHTGFEKYLIIFEKAILQG